MIALCHDLEREAKRRICTPHDFEYLASLIWQRNREIISATTLKRLWGYISGSKQARHTTLRILVQFLGYADWDDYLEALTMRDDIESNAFLGEGVRTEQLKPGDVVEACWLPNRSCFFRYEGENHFQVYAVANSKLQVGDRCDTLCFIVGKPLYLDNLRRGDNPPASYVAGKKNGLVFARIVPPEKLPENTSETPAAAPVPSAMQNKN